MDDICALGFEIGSSAANLSISGLLIHGTDAKLASRPTWLEDETVARAWIAQYLDEKE